MDIAQAIEWMEVIKRCHSEDTTKVAAIDTAISALKYKSRMTYNPKLTLEDLQKMKGRLIWWDYFSPGEWVTCEQGYVISNKGTFSFDFVMSNGSAYMNKPCPEE